MPQNNDLGKRFSQHLKDNYALAAAIRQSLLAEIAERVIGEDEAKPDDNYAYPFYDGRNVLRKEQRKLLKDLEGAS